jgi:hypothetical protein
MDVQPATETLPDTEVAVVELPPPPQKWRVASTVTIGNSAFVQRSQYVAKWATSSEVHVIGVYDGGSSGKHSNISGVFIPGTTQVNVRGMSRMPVSLVLSSYEQTHWVLKGSGVKSLESILVTGYGLSDVTGIDTSKVINRSGPDNRLTSSGHAWTDNGPDDSTASLVAGVESVFGTRIASFTGIYSTSPKLGTVTSVAHPADLQVNVLVR